MLSEDLLKHQSAEDPDGSFYTGDDPDINFYNGDDLDRSFYNGDDPDRSFYDRDYLEGSDDGPPIKSSEDIIQSRTLNGFVCREIPVKETKKVFRLEVPLLRFQFFSSCLFTCMSIFETMLLRSHLFFPNLCMGCPTHKNLAYIIISSN